MVSTISEFMKYFIPFKNYFKYVCVCEREREHMCTKVYVYMNANNEGDKRKC